MINNHSVSHIQRSADRLKFEMDLVTDLIVEEGDAILNVIKDASHCGAGLPALKRRAKNQDLCIMQRYSAARKYAELRKVCAEHRLFTEYVTNLNAKRRIWRETHEELLRQCVVAHVLRPFKGADDE